MQRDDPFSGLLSPDGGTTVRIPKPGGRITAPIATPQRSSRQEIVWTQRVGLNPIETAASALLNLLARLRDVPYRGTPEELRRQTIEAIKRFQEKARELGVAPEDVFVARYVLCTAIDEAVLNTPWGSHSVWNESSLLVTFHQEVAGGEKFFVMLEQHLLKDPNRYLHLLELMYLCLSFGFQGRYGALQDGDVSLEKWRERLFRTIQAHRGKVDAPLSPPWEKHIHRRGLLKRFFPLWVMSAIAGVVVLGVFLVFNILLNIDSDSLLPKLHALGRTLTIPSTQNISSGEHQKVEDKQDLSLRAFLEQHPVLATDMQRGLIATADRSGKPALVIRGDGLFKSGSVAVNPSYVPVLQRIGRVLEDIPGQFIVTGHTDNIPIRTVRFPSNWHLSQARAEAVVEILGTRMDAPARLIAEGRADIKPLVPNNTPANRAKNRRVEIIVSR